VDPYRTQQASSEADRSIVVATRAAMVVGIDRATGALRWSTELPERGTGEIFLAMRYGCLVVSGTSERVYRLDYATGELLWTQAVSEIGRATVLIEPDLILVAKSQYVDALDHGGARLWRVVVEGNGDDSRMSLGVWGNVAQADDPGV